MNLISNKSELVCIPNTLVDRNRANDLHNARARRYHMDCGLLLTYAIYLNLFIFFFFLLEIEIRRQNINFIVVTLPENLLCMWKKEKINPEFVCEWSKLLCNVSAFIVFFFWSLCNNVWKFRTNCFGNGA